MCYRCWLCGQFQAIESAPEFPDNRENTGKTADFADIRACHLDFGKENSGLGAISLNLLTGKFYTVISELVTTNREKPVAAFWPKVSYQILAPA